jgi:hypothetical protein
VPAGAEASLSNGRISLLSTLGGHLQLRRLVPVAMDIMGDCGASGSGTSGTGAKASGAGASASEADAAGGSGSGGFPSEGDDDSDRRSDSSFELV